MAAHAHVPGSETPVMHDAPDSWHDHSRDAETPREPHAEVGNAPKIIAAGILLFGAVAACVVVIYAYYMNRATAMQNEREAMVASGPNNAAREYKSSSLIPQERGGTIKAGGVGVLYEQEIRPIAEARAEVVGQYAR